MILNIDKEIDLGYLGSRSRVLTGIFRLLDAEVVHMHVSKPSDNSNADS